MGRGVVGAIGVGDDGLGKKLFPTWSLMVLGTMANVGLIYNLFLIEVELDMSLVRCMGKKSAVIAAIGLAISFIIATIISLYFKPFMAGASMQYITLLLFHGAELSISSFPVLAHILLHYLFKFGAFFCLSFNYYSSSLSLYFFNVCLLLHEGTRAGIEII